MNQPSVMTGPEGTKSIVIPDVAYDAASIATERLWLSIGLSNNLLRESIGAEIMKLIERIPS